MEAEHIKELDAANEEYDKEHHEKEELKRKVMELEITLARYKADLYDFYAQAGKLPSYERG